MTDEQRVKMAKKIAEHIAPEMTEMFIDMFQIKVDDHYNDLVDELSDGYLKDKLSVDAYEKADMSGNLSELIDEVYAYLTLTYPKVSAKVGKPRKR